MENIKSIGRIIANAYYDFQEIRIATMGRIRDVIRKRIEGIAFNEVEGKKLQKDFSKKYSDDKLLAKWRQLFEDIKITKKEYRYLLKCWEIANEGKKLEKRYKRAMQDYISEEPLYNSFLKKIRGIGPILSANIIKEFGNCSNYETVSRLWANTGNGVVNGKAPKKRKGESLAYSPKLRTLTWKVSDSLLKQNKGYYRQIYDTEKEKQLNRRYERGLLKQKYGNPYKEEEVHLKRLHAHNRALRKMRKIFLDHLWHVAREISNLPAKKNYVEGVLEHNHIISWRDALQMEGGLTK